MTDTPKKPATEGDAEWRQAEQQLVALGYPPAAIVEANIRITLVCPQCSSEITEVAPVHRMPDVKITNELYDDGFPEPDPSTLTVQPLTFENIYPNDLWIGSEKPGVHPLPSEDVNTFICPKDGCNYERRFKMLTILRLYIEALKEPDMPVKMPRSKRPDTGN